MVKTHKSSRFVLYTLENIWDCEDIILQILDTNSNFTSGGKCYLCEVVGRYEYNNIRCERDLTDEICRQNEEIRRQKRKIERLEKELIKERNRTIGTAFVVHGKWEIADTERGSYIRCSNCHYDEVDGFSSNFNYCPKCGAKMGGSEE